MNKEIIYLDDKVIVENEKGEKYLREYSSKIEDILVQENLIEIIENELMELKKQQERIVENKKNKKIIMLLPFIVGIIGITFVSILISALSSGETISTTIFGIRSISEIIIFSCTVTYFPVAVCLSIGEYFDYKKTLKKEKGIENQLLKLSETLKEEKEYLERIKRENLSSESQNNEKKLKIGIIDDKEILVNLRQLINLFYDCGYNEDKYYRYYQNGALKEKLYSHYTDEGIEMIEEYLEEKKGPVLVRKKESNNSRNNK